MDEESHELVFVDAAKKRRSFIQKLYRCSPLALACFLLLVAVGLAVALAVIVSRQDGSSEECPTSVCRTASCSQLARTVADNMDTGIDPCTDFYSFSCGGWVKKNPIPSGHSRYSPFAQLDQRNKDALIGILEGNKDDDIEAIQKLRFLYQLCLNETQLDFLGAKPLVTLIQNTVGGWPFLNESGSGSGTSGSGSPPAPNILNTLNFLRTKLKGSAAFFNLYVYVDDKNSSRYRIFLEQSGLTLPSPESYGSGDLFYAFMNYTVGILRLINPDAPQSEAWGIAKNIFELEKKLADIFVPAADLRDPDGTYNNMTIEQLSKRFTSPFNWSYVVEQIFSLGNVTSPMHNEPVIVRTPTYFANLSEVLVDVDNQTLLDYTVWQLITGYIQYLSADFLSVYHNFTLAVYGSGLRSRNETCLALVQSAMPIALARPYTEYILPGGIKDDVEVMISAVKTAFKERVNSSTWLDQFTKDKCNEKVDSISQRVAYPSLIYHESYINGLYEKYTWELIQTDLLSAMANINCLVYTKDLGRLHTKVDRMEWDYIAPTAVNAYYNPSFNQFTFLEGILAPPFISSGWPRYFTYGAFGTVIGHELTHGFDDQGQQYDAHGDLRPWWDSVSTDHFKQRQKCFVEQYSKYEIFGHHVDGNLTLGENLADNGGLKTSYQAYKNIVELEGTQRYLPGLDYSPDQLFFIAFAQLWCSNFTPEYITSSLLTNPHSPGPFRVNGTLVNSQEFADAFKCTRGSPMNPGDKCLMW